MNRGRPTLLTLVAVFASLGLGLMIGAAISGSNEIWLHHQALLKNLEAEVARVRSVQDQLTLQLHAEAVARQTAENVNHTLLEWVAADRLPGERIAILYASPAVVQAARRLRELLQLAGSQIIYERRLDTLAGDSAGTARMVEEMVVASAGKHELTPEGSESETPPSTPAERAAGPDSLVMLVLIKAGELDTARPMTVQSAATDPRDAEKAVLDRHRVLLDAAREQGIGRVVLGIFRDGHEITDSLVQLYIRHQALVVDGVEKSGGQAALVLGLCVGVRGLMGVFPDAVLIPAYPRAIPADAQGV